MEMKVWMDGYQRVICGVTDQTTCQDVMIALAHASGKTGRFTMFEKWRTNERCLSPTDFPLLILQKWGEYSSDVQLILRHTSVGSGKKHRTQPLSGHLRPASSPPDHAPVKKSLTFSGAHRRTSSTEQPVASNGRVEGTTWNVCHSVESSEQSSIASQSSASLSPYMSLERQTQKTDKTLSNGDFEKDFHLRHIWLPDHLKQNSDDRTLFANTPAEDKSPRASIPSSQNSFSGVSRSQHPTPSARSSKMTSGITEVRSQIPKPTQRKEALPSEIKQKNGNIELETEHFHSRAAVSLNARVVSNSPLRSDAPNALKATDSSKTPMSSKPSIPSSVSSSIPSARNKNETLVTNFGPKVYPSKLAIVKQTTTVSRSYEERNSPRKETEKLNQPKEISGNEPGLKRLPPIAAKRHRPVAVNAEEVTPLRTDSNSTVTPSVEPVVTLRPTVKQTPQLEDPERLKEAQERKELIELIGRQEREMLKCESQLKDLNHEISLLEGDLEEVDESQLESQVHKIDELEAVERQLEEEILELELISWEDKLILEKQKENRIRTEILLLQSSIAKSETEILSFVEKIQSLTMKTEEATQEVNRFLEEKKEKENKEIEDLESSLLQAEKELEASVSAIKSLEQEILASDRSLSKKKEELAELEGQLRKLNLELFLQEPREIASTRRSRTPVLERLGLSRPGSSHRLQRCQLSPSPLRLNRTIDETNRPALGYVV